MSPEKLLLEKKKYKTFIIKLTIILWFVLSVFIFYKIMNIIIILIISLFLNILFAPILNKLNKWKIWDTLWIIIIYLIIFVFVVILFVAIVPIFIKQIALLIDILNNYLNNLIYNYNAKWIEWLWLPSFLTPLLTNIDFTEIFNSIKGNIGQISTFVSGNLKNFLTSWAWIVFSITSTLMSFVLVSIFTFFIALERKTIRIFFYKIIPENISRYLLLKESKIVWVLTIWLRSQFILWISIFTITLLWLLFIKIFWVHIDGIFTLALIAGMMEFVPYIWPLIALLPALSIALIISWKATIIVFILYICIQQLENNLVVPYIMWKNLSLSPFSVLMAVIIWASLFWFVWILMSVPLVAIINIFLSWYLDNRKLKNKK